MEKINIQKKCIIQVCVNERDPGKAACGNRGSFEIYKKIKDFVISNNLINEVMIMRTGCMWGCNVGPNIMVHRDGKIHAYKGVTEKDADNIIELHIRQYGKE